MKVIKGRLRWKLSIYIFIYSKTAKTRPGTYFYCLSLLIRLVVDAKLNKIVN